MNINKALVILSLCLLLLSLVSTSTVYAQVSIKTTCYNSNSIVTEDLRTENADYYGITVLAPAYIISNGAGESVDDEFSEFYHRVFAANEGDSESIAAYLNLKTESGGYEWVKEVTTSSEGLSMGMSVDGEIENGNLEASYRNSLSSHIEELMTNDAKYSESTIITPSTIASDGIGNSLLKESKSEDDETDKENNDKNQDENADNYLEDENENSGFYHMIYVEGQGNGKWAEINSTLTAESMNTSYAWKKGVKVVTQNYSLGMALVGVSNNGSIKTIEMHGKASNFPAQHLPPGEVVVTTVESENNQVDISEAANEFYEDFFENPTALYYNMEQECSIPTGDGGGSIQSTDIESEEHFSLGMSFLVEHKGNG